MARIEYSDRRGGDVSAYASLARQAGMTIEEFAADVEAGGLHAAVRRAAERATRRRRDPRRLLLELLKRRER